MEKNTNEFGIALNKFRKKANMTLSELADKANTSDSYLSQLENGKRNPPKPKLLKDISTALAKGDEIELAFIYGNLSVKAGYDLKENEFNDVMSNAFNSKILSDVKNILQNERGISYISSAIELFNNNKHDDSYILFLNVLLIDLKKYQLSSNSIEKKALETEIFSIINNLLN